MRYVAPIAVPSIFHIIHAAQLALRNTIALSIHVSPHPFTRLSRCFEREECSELGLLSPNPPKRVLRAL